MRCETIIAEGERQDRDLRRLQVRTYATDPDLAFLFTETVDNYCPAETEIGLTVDEAQELVDKLNLWIKSNQRAAA